jgi:hypothetical protein
LSVECAQGGFNRLANSDDAFLYARTKKSHPELTPIKQLRSPSRGRTARMRGAVTLHSFHRRQGRIPNEMPSPVEAVIRLHPTLKTSRPAGPDVLFCEFCVK